MGEGGLSHTTRILPVTLKPLKLWLPNFVNPCFYLLPQFKKILAKRSSREVATVIFQTRGHDKLET